MSHANRVNMTLLESDPSWVRGISLELLLLRTQSQRLRGETQVLTERVANTVSRSAGIRSEASRNRFESSRNRFESARDRFESAKARSAADQAYLPPPRRLQPGDSVAFHFLQLQWQFTFPMGEDMSGRNGGNKPEARISEGEASYIAPGKATSPAAAPSPSDRLTEREREVLSYVALGHSSKQVAGMLGISFKTAACHRYRVMRKLGIHDTASLVLYAIRSGFVQL